MGRRKKRWLPGRNGGHLPESCGILQNTKVDHIMQSLILVGLLGFVGQVGVVGGVVWSYDALLASRQKHAVTWAQLRSQGIVIAVKSGRNSPVDGMRKDRSWRSRGDKRICSTFPRLKQKRTFYETKLFFYRHTCLILYFKVNFTQRDQCSISTVVLRHAPL